MGAEARRRSIAGLPAADGAQVPPRPAPVKESTTEALGDDLEFPDEPARGPAVAEGALVVVPEAKSRRRKPAASVVADDDGIDS